MNKKQIQENGFLYLKKVMFVFIAIVLSSFLFMSCQPSPQEPFVVNKNNGALEEKISDSTEHSTDSYIAPAYWQETVERGRLTISIDLDIQLPLVEKYPVVKVTPAIFTQDQINSLVDYFAPNKKLYKFPSVMTKSDYEKQLIEAQHGQLIDGTYVVTDQSREWVKELEEKIKNAPETYQKEYTDTSFSYRQDNDGNTDISAGENYLNVGVENADGNGNDALILASNFFEGKNYSTGFSYKLGNMYQTESFYEMNKDIIEEMNKEPGSRIINYEECFYRIKITKQDAQKTAEAIIKDLKIQDMMLVNAEKAVFIAFNNQYDRLGINNSLPDRGGYVFEYMRSSGGIPGYNLTSYMGPSGLQPEYAPPFIQEQVTIIVTDLGVEYFSWDGCANVINTENENVSLIPFEKIQDKIKNQIYFKRAGLLEDEDLQNIRIVIDSMQLRTAYISVKDNLSQALLVPVWVFDTTETLTRSNGSIYTDHLVYMLNAIDGGEIGLNY